VLPGGQLSCSTFGLELQNIEEVLGDAQGRLACLVTGEHVEVCGEMSLPSAVHSVVHSHKLVLSASKLADGQLVKVLLGGNLHYPVSVQPRCDRCTCGWAVDAQSN
jgi:hypothetical protein